MGERGKGEREKEENWKNLNPSNSTVGQEATPVGGEGSPWVGRESWRQVGKTMGMVKPLGEQSGNSSQ